MPPADAPPPASAGRNSPAPPGASSRRDVLPDATGVLLRRCAVRHWRMAPGATALLVLILALGVAVFVAVRLANRAAVASFTHFADTLTGQSDWLIRAPAGTLPESVLSELVVALGEQPVELIPVVETSASEPLSSARAALAAAATTPATAPTTPAMTAAPTPATASSPAPTASMSGRGNATATATNANSDASPSATATIAPTTAIATATTGTPISADAAATLGTPWARRTFTLLGVDLLALANLAERTGATSGYFNQAQTTPAGPPPATDPALATATAGARGADDRAGGEFWAAFARGPQLWVSAELGLTAGATLDLVIGDKQHTLPIAGVIPVAPDAPRAPATLLVADLPQVQRLADRVGRIDRIEFIVAEGPAKDARRAALGRQLEALGRDRWVVSTPGARRETAETMTAAFRLNLTVLSLIALLVGLYLVFQALDGAVVRRRAEIATLRSLGVTPREIYRAWLLEAAVLGLAGGALGLLLGWAGAQGAVRAVGQTVNALYYSTTVASAALVPVEIGVALAVSVLAAIIAGLVPARLASLTPPAQVLARAAVPEAGAKFAQRWGPALAFLVVGLLAAQLPPLRLAGGTRFPLAGYAAAFLWIAGAGLVTSHLLPIVGRTLRTWGSRLVPARLALSHLRRPSGRHRLAVAALVCAIAMTAGMAILVASFEHTIRGWIAQSLRADLYVSSLGGAGAGDERRLAPATWRALAAHPAVAHASVLTAVPIELAGLPTTLSGASLADIGGGRVDLPWIEAPAGTAWQDPARNAGSALASESFAERFGRRTGDTVVLPLPGGPREVVIVGLFADYGNERGSLLVDRSHLVAWIGDDGATSVALHLHPGAQPETVAAALRAEFPALGVLTNATLRREILRIFRQTFAITYALEVIGVIVALTGLGLALASVLLDRRDELTTLRALGLARAELAGTAAIEGGAVALAAALGGLLLSGALGWLLIFVVNKQSFGWTLSVSVPWAQLAALGGAVVATGALVSYGVGWWGAALPADREE